MQTDQKPLKKKVADLEIGDKVESSTGEILTIRKLGHGWFRNPSTIITYNNGEWSCLLDTDTVTIIQPSKP